MKRMTAIIATWLTCASSAGEPQSPASIATKQIPVSYVTLGSLVVGLETTTLPALINTLESGVLRPTGRRTHDGGGDEVCFSYPGGVIRFTSDSEMGGSDR